jgi:alanyl-tRNA synthetase
MAIDRSLIGEYGSVDTYRLGRSLRRKGFITEDFDPAVLQQAANLTLSGWVASGAAIRIEREGEALTDRRYWQCALPQGTVSIPCGGTHADSLGAFESVHVETDAQRRRRNAGAADGNQGGACP